MQQLILWVGNTIEWVIEPYWVFNEADTLKSSLLLIY